MEDKTSETTVITGTTSTSTYEDWDIDDMVQHIRNTPLESDAVHNAKKIKKWIVKNAVTESKRSFRNGLILGLAISLLLFITYLTI
jgi:hypothetical protein